MVIIIQPSWHGQWYLRVEMVGKGLIQFNWIAVQLSTFYNLRYLLVKLSGWNIANTQWNKVALPLGLNKETSEVASLLIKVTRGKYLF